MRPIVLDEIVDRGRYESLRADYRSAVIAHKRDRRVALGDKVTIVFEDRETLRFQMQEMIWIEHITDPGKIQHEIDVYNELIPGESEFSATLFIEITELEDIKPELQRLIGLDEHVSLVIGEADDETAIQARFDPRQSEDDRLSAVQYIRFRLDADATRRFADPRTPARLRCAHPNYPREAPLPPGVRSALARDLAEEPSPLLRPTAASEGPRDEVLFEDRRVRARVPARAALPGQVVVEPVVPVASLLAADPELLAALQAVVQRVAAELVRRHGACRVTTEVDPEGDGLRWHLVPGRSEPSR